MIEKLRKQSHLSLNKSRINLTTEMKDLYTENNKSLKEIENDRTGKIYHIHESEEVNLK